MERDFGITNYLGDREISVPCVLKELYSDFIVQEVLEDKTVLQLRTGDEIRNLCQEEEERSVDETVTVPSFLNSEHLQSMDAMDKNSKPLLIILALSKDDRKTLHEFVRVAISWKTEYGNKGKSIEVNYCESENVEQDGPNQESLYVSKENKDTSYALGVFANSINGDCKHFPNTRESKIAVL
ncbi:hypothetical protein COOONC_21675 [Cooperia oncophora]